MDFVEDGFGEMAEAIRRRRVADVELDEICQDYELLTTDLRNAMHREGERESAFVTDLRNSLAGLRDEILERMNSDRRGTG